MIAKSRTKFAAKVYLFKISLTKHTLSSRSYAAEESPRGRALKFITLCAKKSHKFSANSETLHPHGNKIHTQKFKQKA